MLVTQMSKNIKSVVIGSVLSSSKCTKTSWTYTTLPQTSYSRRHAVGLSIPALHAYDALHLGACGASVLSTNSWLHHNAASRVANDDTCRPVWRTARCSSLVSATVQRVMCVRRSVVNYSVSVHGQPLQALHHLVSSPHPNACCCINAPKHVRPATES